MLPDRMPCQTLYYYWGLTERNLQEKGMISLLNGVVKLYLPACTLRSYF